MTGLIVGLVGPIGVGKTTIGDYFASKGYKRLKFSDPIKEETNRLKLPHTREIFQDVGDSLRERFGNDYIARALLEKVRKDRDGNFVVEGFRNPDEIKPFLKLSNFILLGLNADPEVRYQRLKKRSEPRDPKNFEEFKKQAERDQGMLQPAHGQQVLKCLELADFVIDTDKVKSEVFRQVEEVLKEFQNDPGRTNTRRSQGCDFC